MNDRIKLAEAMGWKRNAAGDWYDSTKEHAVPRPEYELPDPENDANDDYAVLEHYRRKYSFAKGLPEAHEYQIGDYARAALKVLNDE